MNYYIHIQELILDAWVGSETREQWYRPITLNLVLEISGEIGDDYDDLQHAVDYDEIISKIRTILSTNKFNLLETLAALIAKMVIAHPKVKRVEVSAKKPHLPNSKHIFVTVIEEKASEISISPNNDNCNPIMCYIRIQELILDAWVGSETREQWYRPITLNLVLEISGKIGNDYDNLQHTVDYDEVISRIKTILSTNKFKLLETLVTRIAKMVIAHPKVKRVEVSAKKPHLPNIKHIFVTVIEEKV